MHACHVDNNAKMFNSQGLLNIGQLIDKLQVVLEASLSCQEIVNLIIQAVFGSRKIFSRNAIFGKGKYFQVFGCIMKIVVENIFMCLVLF